MWNRRREVLKPSVVLDERLRPAQVIAMQTRLFAVGGPKPALALQFAGFAAALLMVAAATLVGMLIAPRWGNAPVVLLYLPPVLLAAIYCGLWPAVAAAVAATLTFNFYFTAPYRTFIIHSLADAVTVAILFLVATVTSRLTASLRGQAQLAAAHAARNATIAGFARRLLSCRTEPDIAVVTVEDLARLFGCHAALLASSEQPWIVASMPKGVTLAPNDLATAALTLQTGQPAGRGIRRDNLADWQFHSIAPGETPIAAVGLARDDGTPPVEDGQFQLLGNLLDQVALALERARLEREAREAARSRERDAIRSALLASIGEDIKPRLNTIVAAARALKRSGGGDKATLATVAAESAKLNRYIDNLVDLESDDREIQLQIGPLAIDLHRRSVKKDGKEVHLTPKEYAVLAELAKHAGRVLTHSQLLRMVWGPAQEQHVDYLRVAIRALRLKLERSPAEPELIVNEPSVGYRLTMS
jgi:K+-sensing histidine kinase KdpD